MVTTVEAGFREFHGRLTPTGGESQAAKDHRASIEACLEENFEIMRFFRTGSFGNGTSIRGYSDVDYFASIPTKNLKSDSDATLRQMRDVLDARFPHTGVAVRTPAVLAPFGTDASESTCKRQGDTEPSAEAKLSHLLAFQTIRTMGPASVNSGESENSRPPW